MAQKIQWMVVATTVVLALAWLWVATSAVIYFGRPVYRQIFVKEKLDQVAGMELPEMLRMQDALIDFLFYQREGLEDLKTKVDGQEVSFFNAKVTRHMRDVRELLRLSWFLAGGTVLLALFLERGRRRPVAAYAASRLLGIGLAVMLLFLLGLAIALGGFHEAFWTFHHIFFRNNLWLFDPARDYIIRFLPEVFFLKMACLIAGIWLLGLALAYLRYHLLWQKAVKA